MREFLLAQEKAKAEPVTLSYTFRSEVTQRELSSTMHQGTLAVLKGTTAEEVAKRVRAEVELLGEKFKLPEVSGVKDLHRELMLIVGAGGQKFGSFVDGIRTSLGLGAAKHNSPGRSPLPPPGRTQPAAPTGRFRQVSL